MYDPSTHPTYKHGHWVGNKSSPTYNSWQNMRHRCTDPKHERWALYGGRGIKVCDRWMHSFEAFLADMGERPAGMTLDRQDNDGDYTPVNCKWSTQKEQTANQRKKPAIGAESGTIYGKLRVIERVNGAGKARVRCLCSCGNETIVRLDSIRRGFNAHCGHCRYENFYAA